MGALSRRRARARRSRPAATWSSGASASCARCARPGGGRVHVKLDSGMGRLGTRDAREGLARGAGGARGRGSRARGRDDPLRHRRRTRRRRLLRRPARGVHASWARPLKAEQPELLVHAANSAAMLRDRRAQFDMVRCGIAIYGMDPFGSDPAARGLEPALELSSLRGRGQAVRGGRERRLRPAVRRPSATPRSACCPIGYGDGWRRGLSNNADVLVGGRRHPLVGTVSMDSVTVDLGAGRPRARAARRAGDPDRPPGQRADHRRGGRAAARHDQLRDHLRAHARVSRASITATAPRCRGASARDSDAPAGREPRHERRASRRARGARGRARLARGRRGPRPPARRVRPATSTSSSTAIPGRPRARSRGRRGGRRASRSRRSSAPGAWSRATLAGSSTWSRCAAAASRRTSRCATSPSTRSPSRSPGRSRSTRSAASRDLDARRLRMAGPAAFASDPLRVLRLVRIAVELDLRLEPRHRAQRRDQAAALCAGLRRAGVRRAAPDRRRTRRPARPRAARRAAGARGRAARARGAAGRRAEPLSPPRRLRAQQYGNS